MSVTRKPSYDLASVLNRVTWFPILHDMFSRMWAVLALGVFGAWGILARWRRAADGERLLFLWVAVGIARTARPRRRQRTALRVPHPGARRAGEPRAGARQPVAGRGRARAAPRLLLVCPGHPLQRLRPHRSRSRGCRSWKRSTRTTLAFGPAGRAAGLRAGRVVIAAAGRAWRPRPAGACGARGRDCPRPGVRGVEPGPVRRVGGQPDLRKLRGLARHRPGAAAGNARPGQARQRPVARKPDPADLHRPRVRQLRRPERA